MNEGRKRVFARSGFAADEHVRVRRSDAFREPDGFAHRIRQRNDFDHYFSLKELSCVRSS